MESVLRVKVHVYTPTTLFVDPADQRQLNDQLKHNHLFHVLAMPSAGFGVKRAGKDHFLKLSQGNESESWRHRVGAIGLV